MNKQKLLLTINFYKRKENIFIYDSQYFLQKINENGKFFGTISFLEGVTFPYVRTWYVLKV